MNQLSLWNFRNILLSETAGQRGREADAICPIGEAKSRARGMKAFGARRGKESGQMASLSDCNVAV